MNIFFLHRRARACARLHVDKHVVKMILETCQLLCTAWHVVDPLHSTFSPPYKKTHVNHPCAQWARRSRQNYAWLCELGLALCAEYTFRYGRIHKCHSHLLVLATLALPVDEVAWSDPPQAIDDAYKSPNAVVAYRNYYAYAKTHLHAWKGRSAPRFIARRLDPFVRSHRDDRDDRDML